jgi:hypothetical protein
VVSLPAVVGQHTQILFGLRLQQRQFGRMMAISLRRRSTVRRCGRRGLAIAQDIHAITSPLCESTTARPLPMPAYCANQRRHDPSNQGSRQRAQDHRLGVRHGLRRRACSRSRRSGSTWWPSPPPLPNRVSIDVGGMTHKYENRRFEKVIPRRTFETARPRRTGRVRAVRPVSRMWSTYESLESQSRFAGW